MGGFVPRLTKSDIENALLTGEAVSWTDANGKAATIQLAAAKQRRLLAYLLNSKIRDVKGLSQAFIDGLAAAHVAVGDPGAASVQQTVNPSASGPWKIQALKIEGFGGVNLWNGKPFGLALIRKASSWRARTGAENRRWLLRSSGRSQANDPETREIARSTRRSLSSTSPVSVRAHGRP
jgi:hypothetical protein